MIAYWLGKWGWRLRRFLLAREAARVESARVARAKTTFDAVTRDMETGVRHTILWDGRR